MCNKSCKDKEAELKKVLNRALKRLIKTVESEPTLIIEVGPEKTGADTSSLEDVQAWLFSRKEDTP